MSSRTRGLIDRDKIDILERILKFLTGAAEIRYVVHNDEDAEYPFGYVEIVGIQPEDISAAGVDQGLEVSFDSEIYQEDHFGTVEPRDCSRIIMEIWFSRNPWDKIEELEGMLEEARAELCYFE